MKNLSCDHHLPRTLRCLLSTFAAATLVAGTNLAAAEVSSLSEDDFLANIPVAITASRLAQPLNETPTAVTVIDREMIKQSGATELVELLRLVPGMAVGSFAAGRTAVSYHGLSNSYARRMQVLVDGRSVYEPSFGGVHWLTLPMAIDDIEKIEIIRGPSAATHGANALLGVISITTTDAAAQHGTSVKLAKGAADVDHALVRHGASQDDFSYRISGEHRSTDGFGSLNDAYFANTIAFRGELRHSPQNTATIQLGASGFHALQGGQSGDIEPTNTLVTFSNFEQVDLRHTFSSTREFNLRLYHTSSNEHESWTEEPASAATESRNAILFDRNATKERTDLELENVVSFNELYRMAWGGGLRQDKVKDAAAQTEPVLDVKLYRLFANLQARPTDNLVSHVGAMLEHHSLVGSDVSPRVALNYHVSAHHTFRTGYSRAFRNPVISEENANLIFRDANDTPVFTLFKTTGGLVPEKINSFELGYYGNFPEYGLTLDVKVYRDKITNLIRSYFDLTSNALNFRNADEANVTGAEIEAAYRRHGTRANVTYSNQDIDSENITGRYTTSAPHNKWTLFLAHRFNGALDTSLTYVYVGPMEWLGTREPLKSYDRLDVRVAHPFKMGNADCEVAIVGQGLSGPYADFVGAAKFDRRAYLSLRVQAY